jgi:nucleotide-binding universal stress UspA family protein
MIKNVLVPIDYSEASLNALDTAIHIAACNNAFLKVLHVNDTMYRDEEPDGKGVTKEMCDIIAQRVFAQYNARSKTIFAEGIVGHAIINAVLENKIDLVVMGSHGTSGSRDLIGFNSYYTAKRAPCPVLLIPEGKKWTEFNNVLFPVRPALFSFKLYKFPENLLRKNKRSTLLRFLGVTTDNSGEGAHQLASIVNTVNMKKQTPEIELSFEFNNNPDIAEGVLSCVEQTDADLLIIPPGLDIVSRPFFIGPFSQRIINHAKIPILSILRTS